MAAWHLEELRTALENRGWRLIAQLPGPDHNVSAVWLLKRRSDEPMAQIAFEGLDDLSALPLEQAYGCHLIGDAETSLYFKKRARDDRPRHRIWRKQLEDFITRLDKSLKRGLRADERK
jgi:hypothetical protein